MASSLPAASDPAETAVSRDIVQARMHAAADAMRFGVVAYKHPFLFAWVKVGGGRLGLRMDVAGYPGNPPAGQLWDLATDRPLDVARWPVGGRPVFRRDWSVGNGNAPYLAVDRVALGTHPNWRTDLPGRAWTSSMTVYEYLSALHEALSLSRLPGQA